MKMASTSFRVSSIILCALINRQLSTPPLSPASFAPRFCTVCEPAFSLQGSTSLLNFISDGAVFPNRSLLWALRLEPVLTFWGRVLPSKGQVPACPRDPHATMLLQRPRDCGRVPAHPRKIPCNCVAAAVQGLW